MKKVVGAPTGAYGTARAAWQRILAVSRRLYALSPAVANVGVLAAALPRKLRCPVK